jgi:hypothetical protein
MGSAFWCVTSEVGVFRVIKMAGDGLDAGLAVLGRYRCLDSSYLSRDVIIIVRVIGCVFRKQSPS